ncbi:SMP-30/gluconolactonase/LRE family protein [Methylobacterium sp. J-068]|uniref:SMP-30/gluconolactonase/LRE family protein n=1 Tax=Methylobacterium sp. J-068 TaxID=2836649 RepID=UPI001FBAF8D0|nr:SMP-30/gluconolactonase/LRE family protein [Methylobacterium sp. J-068]MCJ2032978.1 SMP-30/gluconolactonase/LRE family protein [Methylobacterium sp. J-068]
MEPEVRPGRDHRLDHARAGRPLKTPRAASEPERRAALRILDCLQTRTPMPTIRRRTLIGGALAGLALSASRAPAAPVLRGDDPRFADVVAPGTPLLTLYAQGRWCEGLCYAKALGGLIVSDVRANRMLCVADDGGTRVFRDPSNNANGNTLDGEGRLVTCEHRGRRVVRREHDGRLTVLADAFEGRPLNSPNDAALAPDGAIWFTDPVFGITMPDEGLMATPAQRARRVYRIDPSGTLTGMTEAVGQPNGIAFSPDGRRLYVSDTSAALKNPEGARSILAFPVEGGLKLGAPATFATLEAGVPDGLAVDADGRLYAACFDGVRVYAPDGTRLGRIATATDAANVAFGGPDGRRLFIAAGPCLHAIDLTVRG